ncbi:molybdenum cofactor guanylyltransferase [Rothia halotolerans]|uniref:molybdenum cofactor guanylyltransferase n=1 Tax=Rothia halotolerans TaxID=405770 RepID=UPI00101C455A|nr:NTP transferase domain-containing protein [Rothia halotolerans]
MSCPPSPADSPGDAVPPPTTPAPAGRAARTGASPGASPEGDGEPRLHGLVLAGGRSSRLHSSAPFPAPDKPLLADGSGTLLEAALGALRTAGVPSRRSVVVGPPFLPVPAGARLVREDPPFTGPAAAIAAGLTALGEATGADAGPTGGRAPSPEAGAPRSPRASGDAAGARPGWVLLLAADMPRALPALLRLVEALEAARAGDAAPSALVAVDEGVEQPLLCLLRLDAALAAFGRGSEDASVRSRLRILEPLPVAVPSGSSADVDTWQDAVELGFTGGASLPPGEPA